MIVGHSVHFPEQKIFDNLQLVLEPWRQNSQTHDFYEANIFLLDVLNIRVGMVDAIWKFLRSLIVTQNQIQLKETFFFAGNRCDGMVSLAI